MNPQDKADDSDENTNDSTSSTPVSKGEELINKTKDTNYTKEGTDYEIKKEQTKINDYKHMSTSDQIALGQLILNIVGMVVGIGLLIATLYTLWANIRATAISESNYKLAKEVYETSRLVPCGRGIV